MYSLLVLLPLVMSEIDRYSYHKALSLYEYYVRRFPLPIIGAYNLIIRLFSFWHPDMIENEELDIWFPDHKLLTENWEIMRDEILSLQNTHQIRHVTDISTEIYNDFQSSGWNAFIVKSFSEKSTHLSRKLTPKTAALVDRIPELHFVMFSILEPGATIEIHNGPSSINLRYHLGLQIPKNREECFIDVSHKKYVWSAGSDMLFDDTKPHFVQNNTNEQRIILFGELPRRMFFPIEWFNRLLLKFTQISQVIRKINQKSEIPLYSK